MNVSKIQILKLYKDIIRYGQQLKYTDKEYYFHRVRQEFRRNKHLEDVNQISFNYNVRFTLTIIFKPKLLILNFFRKVSRS